MKVIIDYGVKKIPDDEDMICPNCAKMECHFSVVNKMTKLSEACWIKSETEKVAQIECSHCGCTWQVVPDADSGTE